MSQATCRGVSPCTIASLGLLALLATHQVGQDISQRLRDGASEQAPVEGRSTQAAGALDDEREARVDVVAPDRLAGLWTRYEGRSEGDLLRFWYFHGNGKGLYRYGRVGYANTHSFDYEVRGDQLTLEFRKTGEAHRLRMHVDQRAGSKSLRFENDPRESGAQYRFVAGPMTDHAAASEGGRFGLDDRIWIDLTRYTTGGAGFAMYQLQPAAIDGRGVGWFHEGDWDNWRTEALSYRINSDRIEFFFELNEELGISEYAIRKGSDGRRTLRLLDDPRDFWLSHEYADGGRSFASDAQPALAPLFVGSVEFAD